MSNLVPRAKHLAERGLTTVEYAIGLLGAAAAARLLLKIFSPDSKVLDLLFDFVTDLFAGVASVGNIASIFGG